MKKDCKIRKRDKKYWAQLKYLGGNFKVSNCFIGDKSVLISYTNTYIVGDINQEILHLVITYFCRGIVSLDIPSCKNILLC